ncbi:MAG TPA: hypothetical protein PK924_05110 [Bacilli bacterium]|nr:hypothetical protein [Bacilli bacterium]
MQKVVAIKGFKMPTNCNDCPFSDIEECYMDEADDILCCSALNVIVSGGSVAFEPLHLTLRLEGGDS